jgi:hypothetical protein
MAQKRFGPTQDAGTVILEKEAEKTIQAHTLGSTAYAGILERGAVGSLIITSGKRDLLAKTGGLIPDSLLPDAAQHFWDHSKGAGILFLYRVDDGSGVRSSLTLWDRKNPRNKVIRVDANNVGKWAGKRDTVVVDLTAVPGDITATVITLPMGYLVPKNKWKGGLLKLTGSGVSYSIVSNTAGTAGVRATVTLAGDSRALTDFGLATDRECTLTLDNLNEWGLEKKLAVEVLDGQLHPTTEWGLKVYVNDELVRNYPDLSSDPNAANYYVGVINKDTSNVFITVTDLWTGANTADVRPANWFGAVASTAITALAAALNTLCVRVDSSLAGPNTIALFTYGTEVIPDTYELEVMSTGPTVWRLKSLDKQATHTFTAPADTVAYAADNPKSIGFTVTGGGVAAATLLGTLPGPWNLAPGDTLVGAVDRAADQTATFTASGAARENAPAETYHIDNLWTLLVKVDGGAVQTIVFTAATDFVDHAAATAEEVAAAINRQIVGASATATTAGTKVTITSDKKGYGSFIEVTGGTSNGVLLFNTAETRGIGNDGAGHNFLNIDAVTFAELKPILETAFSNAGGVVCTEVAGCLRITTHGTGAGMYLQVQAGSSCEGIFGLSTVEVEGSGGVPTPGEKFTIYVLPLLEDEAINGRIFYPDVALAPKAGWIVSDNTEVGVSIATGDLTIGGTIGGNVKVRLQYRQTLMGGYDGIHDLASHDFSPAYDPSTSPFNQTEGQGYGLIKHATPGIWKIGGNVDATTVQKAGQAYADQKNHQFRFEFQDTITDEFVAKAYLDTIGRSDYEKCIFPSYASIADPVKDGVLKLVSVTGMVHGVEARTAKDYNGYHKVAAGIYAQLPLIKELPTGDVKLNGEVLNPAGIPRIERKSGNYIVWGARLPSLDLGWKWCQQRELMSYYEHVLSESFDWIIFAINDELEQPAAVAALQSFFQPEWRKRALRGATFEEACEIKMDAENNTNATRDAGDMNVEIKLRLPDTVERFIITMSKMGIFESTAAA